MCTNELCNTAEAMNALELMEGCYVGVAGIAEPGKCRSPERLSPQPASCLAAQ